MAVKQIRVSDLSGRQADDDQLARLVVHEHPQHRGPITLDVLPEEIGELPEGETLVSIEVIQPGDSSGQKVAISLDQFNKLAGGADMNAILMNAVAAQAPPAAGEARRSRSGGAGTGRSKVNYATLAHAGEPHRGRITEAEKELVRGNLDQINKRLRDSGLREIDPNDTTMKERYNL